MLGELYIWNKSWKRSVHIELCTMNSARAWLQQSINSGEKCGRKLSEKKGLATVTISVFDLLGSLKPMTSFQARAVIGLFEKIAAFVEMRFRLVIG